jgi:hypothetical protein
MGQNHNDITSVKIDLQEEAAAIRREFDAAKTAGRTRLEHALAAGDRLLTVDEYLKRGPRQKGGFRDLLRQHGFNKSDQRFHAPRTERRNRPKFRTLVHSCHPANVAHKNRQLRQVEKIGRFRLTPQQGRPGSRRRSRNAKKFLDTIGADSLCTAQSFTLRAELKRRVVDQQRASTSALEEKVPGTRQALSLQKAARPRDIPAAGIASPILSCARSSAVAAPLCSRATCARDSNVFPLSR